jgi:hypothetical protein
MPSVRPRLTSRRGRSSRRRVGPADLPSDCFLAPREAGGRGSSAHSARPAWPPPVPWQVVTSVHQPGSRTGLGTILELPTGAAAAVTLRNVPCGFLNALRGSPWSGRAWRGVGAQEERSLRVPERASRHVLECSAARPLTGAALGKPPAVTRGQIDRIWTMHRNARPTRAPSPSRAVASSRRQLRHRTVTRGRSG